MTSRHLDVETGLADPVYDLVLVLQQALSDTHRYAHFAQDASEHGDDELEALFDDLARQDRKLVDRLRPLLARRLAI